MADRYTEVVVLCEDIMHLNFVRRYLILRGIQSRRIRGSVAPPGRGAGAQYVIERYPIEVKALRSRPHVRAGLVVVVDADNLPVEERVRQLDRSLGQPAREDAERIGILTPKRNIETWIFYLLGNTVNDDDDYKNRVSPSALKEAVAAFGNLCPRKAVDIAVSSLQRACEELTAFLGRVS
jgi:hypothetical protein